MTLRFALAGMLALSLVPAAHATSFAVIDFDDMADLTQSGPNASLTYGSSERTGSASADDAAGTLRAASHAHPNFGGPESGRIAARSGFNGTFTYLGSDPTTLFFTALVEASFFDDGRLGGASLDADLSALDVAGPNVADTFGYATPAGGSDEGGVSDLLTISFDVNPGQTFRLNMQLATRADMICGADAVCGEAFMNAGNSMTLFLEGFDDLSVLSAADGTTFVPQLRVEDDGGSSDAPEPATLGLLGLGVLGLALRRRRRA